MFAQLASGHVDLADVCFLLAAIFAAVATVVTIARGAVEGALIPAAVALVAFAFFVL